MKKTTSIVILLALSLSSVGQLTVQSSLSSETGLSKVRPSEFSTLPSYIQFETNRLKLDEAEKWMREKLNLDPRIGFKLIQSNDDQFGYVHHRLQQVYDGIAIQDAIWIIHTKETYVTSMNGLIYPSLESLPTVGLDESVALEKAKDYVGASLYKWEMEEEEQHLKWEKGDPNATYMPKGELVFVTANRSFDARSYRLAYKFNIYAHAPLSRAELFVDANSGEILRENELIHHVDVPGTAQTAYSGSREIIADSFEGQFRLRDGSRGNGIRTFDMNTGMTYGGSVDFVDGDNDWNNINPQLDEYATDAHWGAEMTYDYFMGVHSRNSIDAAGFQLNSYVHYDYNFFNAFWDGERMTYGDGDEDESVTPLTALDIAGHEITHGLTNFSANLIYAGESGALNESFSDIFATAIEHFARPSDWDWLIGEEIGVTIRSMSNPNAFSCPDTYGGDFWDEYESVHTNSGVQNFWYYLLTQGGSGVNDNGDSYSVTGMGFDVSDAIAFRNLTVYLTPSSNYEEARYFSIQAATDLFGGCSPEVEATTNAWFAVGVGEPYIAEVVAAFTMSENVSCMVPFTVDFSNESINGFSCLWNFGDGSTSTDAFPTHTYTVAGTYDVTLTVDGGSCGDDEIISLGAITIDESLACPEIFPVSGIGATLTSCSGTLYDSGGKDGNYPANQSAQLTISPTDADNVQLNFVEFDIEGEPSCGFDRLRIFDGPTTGSPLIGSYCNVNVPGLINSTGPSITLVFESDDVGEFAGFKIEWTCTENIDYTGVDESSLSNFSIYPNPAQDFITINAPKLTDGKVEIVNLLGQKIINSQINNEFVTLNLSPINAPGVYFIYLYDNESNIIGSQKFVIQ